MHFHLKKQLHLFSALSSIFLLALKVVPHRRGKRQHQKHLENVRRQLKKAEMDDGLETEERQFEVVRYF
jgi:hypothetical protein